MQLNYKNYHEDTKNYNIFHHKDSKSQRITKKRFIYNSW